MLLLSVQDLAEQVRPMVCDTVLYVNTAIREQKRVVVEGANATMLDIDFGECFLHLLPMLLVLFLS